MRKRLDKDHVELIWGASGALLVYQMGIVRALCEQHSRVKLLHRLKLVGVSGGSATAGYMFASIHGIGDIGYWYKYHVRRVCESSSERFWGKILNWNAIYLGCRI